MFGANKVSNIVENAIKSNNRHDMETAEKGKLSLTSVILGILFVILLNLVVGPWLWNNVLRRLVPKLGKARWYDILLLALLMGLIIPN
tara:strand:- start:5 stop:268 length:264 start_codon:yes stop_codon:yes gene_type:complete